MSTVGLALMLLVLAASSTSAQSIEPSAASCGGHWSAPFHIERPDGRAVYIERGVIAPLGDRTIALGSPTFFWLGKDHIAPPEALTDTSAVRWSFTRAGAFVDSVGKADGVPTIDQQHRFILPRLVAADANSISVAWGVVDSTAKDSDEPNRIEIASFDGRTWKAVSIISAQKLERYFPPTTAVRPRAPQRPMAYAAVARDSGSAFVRLAYQTSDKWRQADWNGNFFMIHGATAFAQHDGSVSLLVAATKEASRYLYWIRGTPASEGVAWQEPQLVDTLPGSFETFSSARLGGDSLVVVWFTRSDGGSHDGMMKTVVSVNGGRAWAPTAPLLLSSAMDGQQLVVDDSGHLHVLYRGAPAEQGGVLNAAGVVVHSRWRAGVWTTPTAVSREPSITGVAAGAAQRGRLLVTWAEAVLIPGGAMPKSLGSFWTPGC